MSRVTDDMFNQAPLHLVTAKCLAYKVECTDADKRLYIGTVTKAGYEIVRRVARAKFRLEVLS